jgi:hypothetical protein
MQVTGGHCSRPMALALRLVYDGFFFFRQVRMCCRCLCTGSISTAMRGHALGHMCAHETAPGHKRDHHDVLQWGYNAPCSAVAFMSVPPAPQLTVTLSVNSTFCSIPFA